MADVVVEGARSIDAARVRALSGLTPGEHLTQRAAQRAIVDLWDTGFFDDVALSTRPVPDGTGLVVTLRVVEAPVLTRIRVEGADKVKEKDVLAKLGLRPGDRLARHRMHQAALDVEALYREEGFYLAEVEIEAEQPGADSTAMVTRIREGRKVAIEAIEFAGNEVFDDARLRKVLDTETEGFWFWKDGEFEEEKWREDLSRRLPAFYGRHGYLDMTVIGDSLAVDPQRGRMRLYVTVSEGRRYTTGEIGIEGNSRFSQADLRSLVQVAPGEVFDAQAVERTQGEIQDLYADDGYIYAQVQPVREVRPDTTVVDLTWRIREGNPAHIHLVEIKGNTVTHESVVRRQLFVTPGERFRATDVRNSLLSLEGLGFFEPGIVPSTRVSDPETGDIDLTFEVRERRTGSLTLGAAIGGGTGLSGFLGYEQPNLFGQGKTGRVRWEFGSRNNNLELGYTEPVFLGSRTSASFSFFDINQRYINTGFRQEVIGGNLNFGTPLPWDDASRVFYGYKWQRINLESTDEDDTRFSEEYPRTESSLRFGLVRDTRLPRQHPVQGARHSVFADYAGGVLGGSVGFHKYEVESSWFAPTYNDRTILNLRFELGGIVDTEFVPLTEQFLLGGVQIPAQGLRGYRDNCVGVRNAGQPIGVSCGSDRGNAFLLLTAEHFVKITDTVYTSLFYDAGSVWQDFGDVTFTDLRRGAGVGVQVDLPGFGPLGIDYAYGFDRLDSQGGPDPGWQFHFRFGNLLR